MARGEEEGASEGYNCGMSYPPGTLGFERKRLRLEIEALPWYLWPFKVRLRRKWRAMCVDAGAKRDQAIYWYFTEWEANRRKS